MNILEIFERDGVIFPIEIYSKDEITHYKDLLMYEIEHNKIIESERRCKSSVLFPWLDEITRNNKILDNVEKILGPNFFCWDTQLWIKKPNDNKFVGMHQDATYWNFKKKNGVVVWLAFDDVTEDQGPVVYKLGTHKNGQLRHKDIINMSNLLKRGQTLVENFVDRGTSILTINAGNISIHHPYIVHGSDINRSCRNRIAYSLQYISTNSEPRITDSPEYATLVRGVDNYNYLKHSPKPTGNFQVDLENWKIAHQSQRSNYLKINDIL